MKSLHTWAALLFFYCAILPSSGEVIGIDNFTYNEGSNLFAQRGGYGWDWNNELQGHTNSNSDWANLGGSVTISSGKLRMTGNAATRREYNGPEEGFNGVEHIGAIQGGSTVFARDSVVYYRIDITQSVGVTSSRISSLDFGAERVYAELSSGEIAVGIIGASDFEKVRATFSTLTPEETYTIVVKVDFADDYLSLWVNPDLNQLEGAPGTRLGPTLFRRYTGTNWSTSLGLSSQGTGITTWDNVVVANRWEDLQNTITVTTLIDEVDNSINPTSGTGTSLREALTYGPPGSLIKFDESLSGGTISLARGQLRMNGVRSIEGPSGGITIDAHQDSRVILIFPGSQIELSNLNLTGGKSFGDGGAILFQENSSTNTLVLSSCALYGNSAAGSGGAIYATATNGVSNLSLNSCTISENSADDAGGGIYNISSIPNGQAKLFLNYCTISRNYAQAVGGGYISTRGGDQLGNQGGPVTSTLENSIVAGNYAPFSPDVQSFATGTMFVNIKGTNLISDNSTNILRDGSVLLGEPMLAPLANYGGPTLTMHPLSNSPAIQPASAPRRSYPDQRGYNISSPLTIGAVQFGFRRTVTFNANSGTNTLRQALESFADTPGLVIQFDPDFNGQTITLSSQLVAERFVDGVFVDASNLPDGLTIDANARGRVLFVEPGAQVAFHGITFTGGHSDFDGGAIYVNGVGTGVLTSLSLSSCTISGNSAADDKGGGIYSRALNGRTSVFLNSSTISGNSARNGGGIYNEGDRGQTSVFLRSSTIANNSSRFSGGGIYSVGRNTGGLSAIDFKNTILAENFAGSELSDLYEVYSFSPSRPDSVSATVTGHNLFSTLRGQNFLTTDTPGVIVADPFLGPLGDYGGPTETHLPMFVSPAVNGGGSLNFGGEDQRGFPRFSDSALDIGAVEFRSVDEEFPLAFYLDFDNDGYPNGVERAVGTDLGLPDADDERNLFVDYNSAGFPRINFNYDTSQRNNIRLRLMRSTDLKNFNVVLDTNEFGNAVGFFIDTTVEGGRAFYRLEAVPLR